MRPYGLDMDAVMHEILGEQSTEESTPVASLINAAGKLVQKGVSSVTSEAQLAKSIAADAAWAMDEATLELAAKAGDMNRVAAAHALAQSAASEAAAAGAVLSSDAVQKRVAAARESARQAAVDALVSPRDAGKQATMRAWQKVLAAASTGSTGLVPYSLPPSANFLSRVYGGVPVWGWGLGVIAVGGTVLIIRSMNKKRRR